MWFIPVLRPDFRCFFTMDNLRGYGEDEPLSTSCLGPSSQELPSSSVGSASPPTAQAPEMAGTPSAIVPVMPGPVPPVSAQSGSSLPGSQDSVPPSRDNHNDLPPPPPPAEPYEVFLARVGRALSNTSGSATQPAAAARPRASVTTGNRLPTPFPTYEDSSLMLQSQVQASRIRMPLPASFYTAPPSPWVWPGRGSTVATSVVRAYQPVTPPAALAGHPGPTGHFPGSFPGGPTPVPPSALLFLLFQTLTCTLLPPCAFAEFFWVTRPISPSPPGPLYNHPPQDWPLWLPRWLSRMQWTLHRALPRTWSKAGKRSSCGTWRLAGISLLVMLHLNQPWVPLFCPRTWTPTHCGSWVPLTTERHHGLSVRPDQNKQTVAYVIAVDLVRLLTDIGPGSDTAKCLLTPPPRPDACLLPPSAHGWAVAMFPVGPVPLKVVSGLRELAFLGDPAHLYHVAVVLHPHLHLITAGPGIVRLPLVGLSRLAWLGGLLDNHPCRHVGDPLHLIGNHDDHPGAASCPLRSGPGPPIVIPPYRPPGHLHPKDIGPAVCLHAVSAPGRPLGIAFLDAADQCLLRLRVDDGDQHPRDSPIPDQ